MIIYISRTGNVKNIVDRLDESIPVLMLTENLVADSPYFIFTYTDSIGKMPSIVDVFLTNEQNLKNLKGIIVSGNINFGSNFCGAANHILTKFNLTVPIVRKIDLRGREEDVSAINHKYKEIILGG